MATLNRRKILIAVFAALVQFFIFKYFYPFPSFFTDSYSYIYAAMKGHLISYRPIGYSWFLVVVHFISSSDSFLVFIQYFLLQGAGLLLYFSIGYLYRPPGRMGWVLFFLLLLNPVLLYIANEVSSDALFISLSLIWLTGLLWMIHRPSRGLLVWQLVLLILIFSTRYNALCYPVIAAVAFLLVRRGWSFKLTGILSSVLVLVIGVAGVGEITRQETGTREFSAFSGWQIANNALYVYPYIKMDTALLPSNECRELDRMVREYFDTAGPLPHRGHQAFDTWYMWNPASPLKAYMFARQRRERTGYFVAWNRVAPVLSQYGYYLMSRHPLLFCREYGWPSACLFFYPPLEMLGEYNQGLHEVDETAKDWFHYKSRRVVAASFSAQVPIMLPFPFFYALLNLGAVLAGCCFLFSGSGRRKWKMGDRSFRGGLLLTGVYFVVNAAFCIFATPNMLRYQVAPMIWLLVFVWLALAWRFSRWNPGPAAPMV